MRSLPHGAGQEVGAHLERYDAAAPGLVEAVHVIGSAALDDYHPGTSDLDLVVELAREATVPELRRLAAAHRGPGQHVEAVLLRPGATAGSCEAVGSAPWVRDGELHLDRSSQVHPVTWLQLARYRVTVRGRAPWPRYTGAEVRAYCRRNLAEYWSLVLQATEASLDDGGVSSYWVCWVALGPIRLWHTLLTGEVISKTEGAQLACDRWPDLGAALMDIRAARGGADVPLSRAHATAAVNLGRRILADLRVRPGR